MGSRRPFSATSDAPDFPSQTWLSDLGRRQLAALVSGTCAMLRGAEAMRGIQLDAAHRTLAAYERARGQLQPGCSAQQLGTVNSELLRFDLEGAVQYWRQLASAAFQVPLDLWNGLKAPEAENA